MQPPRKVPAPALPSEIAQGPTRLPLVALTFDLNNHIGEVGPLGHVLDVLQQYGIHSTFFVTGEWATPNAAWLQRLAAEGHEIGNQGWDHTDMTDMTPVQIADQLERTDALVQAALGRTTKPYFRAPLGFRDERLLQIVGELGYQSVFLNLESGDVRAIATPETTLQRVLARTQNGQIILFHPSTPIAGQVIEPVIAGLKERGFQFATISVLVGANQR